MRLLTSIACLALVATLNAQYGTFNAAAVKAARNSTTVVVLESGGTAYDKAIMAAVKDHWTFTPNFEFVTMAELAAQPVAPEKTYLLKSTKVDPVKFEGTFLMLVQGWKAKKGESLQAKDNAFTNVPAAQELAFILIDPAWVGDGGRSPLVAIYVKHLQDYLKLVEAGKITDKVTADRMYSSRTRLVRDTELWLAKDHLDKTLPDAATVGINYTAPFKIKDMPDLVGAVEQQDRSVTISDVVLTVGDHRNKHCFKRAFNAGTGELMYLGDDQAIFGKKEGFLDTDLKNIIRAR